MLDKCNNTECPIVNLYSQICCKLVHDSDTVDYVNIEKYEPYQSDDGKWYCYNFDY